MACGEAERIAGLKERSVTLGKAAACQGIGLE
jgi:hypothetical protein